MAKQKRKFLTKEEELALGYDILAYREDPENEEKREKAIESVQKLFFSNEFFAVQKAINFLRDTQTKNYPLEDAKEDAKVGLLKAIWNYDPRRDTKITTVSNMPIFKELSVRCNFDYSSVSFRDWSNVTYARAKREYEVEKLENETLLEFIKRHPDRYDNLQDRFMEVENVLQGVSSLDFTVDDSDGHAMSFKDLIPDPNNQYNYYELVDSIKDVDEDLFSEELMSIIKKELTPLQQTILFYEYNDNVLETKEDFLSRLNISPRKYTSEINKSTLKIKSILNPEGYKKDLEEKEKKRKKRLKIIEV